MRRRRGRRHGRCPTTCAWPEAGGFPEAFSTAYDALFTQCGLALGERVLVTGAAGGVGSAGVQLAAATGARCVASVRHAQLRDAVATLGARAAGPDEALDLGPFDVVLELVGAASLPGVLGAMALGGRISVIGVGGGARVEVDLLAVMQRRLRISGSTLRSRTLVDKATVAAAVEHHVVPLLAARRVRSCRSRPPSPWTAPPMPTSASPRAASWARSSSSRRVA